MSDNTSSPLRRLTDAARQTHPEAPEDAAQMLCGGLALLPGEPGDLEFFVGAAQHVMLGHLDDAVALRDALDRVQPLAEGHPFSLLGASGELAALSQPR